MAFKHLKNDVMAGLSVFFLALPLCLGIALASHFPPVAGILSAIVGGLIASFCGGAKLSIKGPAAGLIVIILGAVTELGYEQTLAVGAIAALIQILIGLSRKAIIAEAMPPSVIHGMLAAIGVIIVSKQAYVMLGVAALPAGPIASLLHLPFELPHANPIIFGIGLLALLISVVWPWIKTLRFIPSPIIILLLVIPLSLFFNLSPDFLINLPHNILGAITLPDFSNILSLVSLKYIIMLALVGSIESLLTVCALDSITPHARASDLNRDLCAVGVGNLVSASIGGLPMISEIVRSKANVDYGATSLRANFFHGLFMLIAVMLFPTVLNLIPLSALAALLIFVGIKLAAPEQFSHAYAVGKDQFAIFLTTFIVTLATDLLIGVVAGIMLKLIIHIARGNRLMKLFSPTISIKTVQEVARIEIDGPLTFLSYLKLKQAIKEASQHSSRIILSLKAVTYLDHTVFQKFQTLPHEFKHVTITIEENQELVRLYNHPLSIRKSRH